MCTKCKINPRAGYKNSKNTWCKKCQKEYHQNYKKNRPNTNYFKIYGPMYKYNLTQEELNIIYTKQNYKCAICLNPLDMARGTHIDHDHVTGKVRGILCRGCNQGLGFFKDNKTLLGKAIECLSKGRGKDNG